MGFLHYGETRSFAFDDRPLTHLRTVILGKLSLQESLVFTWIDDSKQQSLWLHPSIPLYFEFEESVTPALNAVWIEQLFALAHSPSGLLLSDEPSES